MFYSVSHVAETCEMFVLITVTVAVTKSTCNICIAFMSDVMFPFLCKHHTYAMICIKRTKPVSISLDLSIDCLKIYDPAMHGCDVLFGSYVNAVGL